MYKDIQTINRCIVDAFKMIFKRNIFLKLLNCRFETCIKKNDSFRLRNRKLLFALAIRFSTNF